jgi:hypothetical protein
MNSLAELWPLVATCFLLGDRHLGPDLQSEKMGSPDAYGLLHSTGRRRECNCPATFAQAILRRMSGIPSDFIGLATFGFGLILSAFLDGLLHESPYRPDLARSSWIVLRRHRAHLTAGILSTNDPGNFGG